MNKDLVSIIIPIYNVEPFLKQCIINIIAKNTLFLIFFQSLFLFITKWIKLYDLMNDISHTSIKLLFVIFYSFFIYVISYYIILLIEKCKLEILLGKKFISKGNVK